MPANTELRLTERKRNSIIEAAVKEFQSQGYHATSMNRIAETAQVSKRTLYRHFESKDVLYYAIIEDLIRRTDSAQIVAFDPERDLASQLEELAQSVIENMSSAPVHSLARAGISRLLSEPEIATQIDHQRLLKRVKKWIRQAMSAGYLQGITDIEFAAMQFTGLLKEFAFWPAIVLGEPPASKRKQKRIATETVAMFLARYQ